MSAPHAILLALLSSPALAEPPASPEALDQRAQELDERAAEIAERAEELEALFLKLQQQREAVEDLRFETEALRQEANGAAGSDNVAKEVSDEIEEALGEVRDEVLDEVRMEVDEALDEVIEEVSDALGEALVEANEELEENRESVHHGERIAIGETIVVEVHEEVDEVVSVGGDVDVFGRVLGDATSFGGTVHVHDGGRVDGNAIAIGGHVVVDDNAEVGGRVPLSPTGELHIELGEEPEPEATSGTFGRLLYEIYSHIIFALSFAGVGVLTVGLFPDRVARIARAIQERPVRVAVLGGFVNLMLSAATFFMAITIIGLPIAGLLALFLALAWLFGFIGLCQAIGDRLPFEHKPHGRWLAFLVGVVIVTFVSALGPLGVMTLLAASVIGMGAAFHTRLGGV
ncbi:MAG: hypothetical protein KC912_00755 [Proteobacteria bacterium]|nr:hypothetical protein [Pseudomonadota bacterium]